MEQRRGKGSKTPTKVESPWNKKKEPSDLEDQCAMTPRVIMAWDDVFFAYRLEGYNNRRDNERKTTGRKPKTK